MTREPLFCFLRGLVKLKPALTELTPGLMLYTRSRPRFQRVHDDLLKRDRARPVIRQDDVDRQVDNDHGFLTAR